MGKFQTAFNVLKNNKQDFIRISYDVLRRNKYLNMLSDESFIRLTYRIYFKKSINLKNPLTFNEKLNWLKLNFRLPILKQLVDKYEVKSYVCKTIGEQYIIPTLCIWDNYEDIDLTNLPDKFVLKGSHDSSSVIICNDKAKFDLFSYKERINRCLRSDLFYWGREWPYKGIKKRIIAEVLLEDPSGLSDYKFFCFNGKMKCFKVDFNRFSEHRANYYDENAKLMSIGEVLCPPDYRDYKLPSNIDEMVGLAEKLAEGFPFVRVDFYNVSGKIYFGEMTFYPAAGFGIFTTDEADMILGSWLRLPALSIN